MTAAAPPNPFVGPRAFQEGEQGRFFGRERELEKLLNLLIARRLVLLYAPSGAGKTSLIQAALIPRLRAERFLVRHTVRVNAETPAEAAPLAPNRYLFSTLLNLEEELPAAERAAPETLARESLAGYLERRRGGEAIDEVLIFDQFEELLTLDPTDRPAKEAFLAGLGAALQYTRRWALFAIREDFYGGLRPLLLPLPTRLDAIFQLDLLDASRALDAIREPARGVGVEFDGGTAATLVDDLRRTSVQRPDGSVEEVRGVTIEPVQLQVVCYRLWERKFADSGWTKTITRKDLERAGDVDSALQSYYAERVTAIAAATGISERRIRDWVEEQLITGAGLRGQVLRERTATAGLPNEGVRALVDAHLVRAEERRGATWYELAHDRLVGPVRADNGAWRAANLTALQRQAALWDEQGRHEGQLLRGEALAKAEAETDETALSEVERAFLAACRAVRAAAERERRLKGQRDMAILASLGGIAAILVASIAVIFGTQAQSARQSAERALAEARTAEARANSVAVELQTSQSDAVGSTRQAQTAQAIAEVRQLQIEDQRRVSDSQRLAFAAQSQAERQPATALLLAYEAFHLDRNQFTSSTLRETLAWPTRPRLTLKLDDRTVYSASYSPDGGRIVTASDDGTASVWDAASGQQLLTLQGQGASLQKASYSPDGSRIVAASDDGTASVWDAASGQQLLTLQGHGSGLFGASYSPDGARIVTASGDTTAIVWDAASGEQLLTLQGHTNWVRGASYSPDGARIVTASDDTTAIVWDAASGEQLLTLQGHSSWVWSASFSPDGSRIVTASDDKNAIVWDAASGQQLLILQGHSGIVWGASFSPDGRRIATASEDGTAIIWDIESGVRLTTLQSHNGIVWGASFSPDGRRIATASEDGTAIVWDVSGELLASLRGHSVRLWSARYSPDGSRIVTASSDTTAIVWDAASGERLLTLQGHTGGLFSASYSPDGARIVTASDDTTAIVWDAASGEQLLTLQGHSSWVWSARYSPDGSRIVTASDDKNAIVWGAENGEQLLTLQGHGGGLFGASYSPDGSRIVTASADGTASVWDAASGKRLTTLEGHSSEVWGVSYSPDGARVVTSSADGTAIIWDAASGEQLLTLQGHSARLWGVSYSPDGSRIVTASADQTAIIWDAASGQALTTLKGHTNEVNNASYSPDGGRIVTASDDLTGRQHIARDEDLARVAGCWIWRDVTEDEVKNFGVPEPRAYPNRNRDCP
jgi:WD40 repeat protein